MKQIVKRLALLMILLMGINLCESCSTETISPKYTKLDDDVYQYITEEKYDEIYGLFSEELISEDGFKQK